MITLMMTFLGNLTCFLTMNIYPNAILYFPELMTRLRPAQLTTPRQPLSIMKTFQPKLFLPNFWRWPDFASYAIFLLVFSFSIGLVVWIFRGVHIVSEGIGLVALLIEATLPLPQLFQIIKTKSVHGFSSILMLVVRLLSPWFWFSSDSELSHSGSLATPSSCFTSCTRFSPCSSFSAVWFKSARTLPFCSAGSDFRAIDTRA